MSSKVIIVSIFLLYTAALFLVSYFSSKMIKNQEDYLIGGRRIGFLGTALSASASSNSAGTMIAHAGSAYLLGIQFHWISFSIVLFEFLNMMFLIAPRMRNISGHRDVVTVPDYYRVRFKKMGTVVQGVAATIIGLFMISYMIAQYKGMSFTIQNVLGLPFATGVIISAVVVTLYTLAGGYFAVVYTDVVQGSLMFLCQLVVPVAAILAVGGFTPAMDALKQIDPNMLPPISNLGWLFAIGMLFASIGATGNPHIITRYISVKNGHEIRKAALTTLIFDSIVAYGSVLVGLFGRVLFPLPGDLPMGNSEFIYFKVAESITGSPIVMGLIYAAIFAAIMSTIDSMLLVISSVVVKDFWQQIIRKGKELPEGTVLKVNRIVVVCVAVIAMVGTFYASGSIMVLALFAWAGVGCSIGPPILLSLWWPRMNSKGAIAGMVGGVLTAVIWHFSPLGGIIYEALPTFAASLIISYVVSIATAAEEDPTLVHDLTTPSFDEMEGKTATLRESFKGYTVSK